jgi:hypothetical protein
MYRLHIFTLINVVYYNCCLLCDDLCTTSHSSTFRTEKPRFNRHFVGPSLHISCETQTPNNNFPYYLNLCAQTVNTKCKKCIFPFMLCLLCRMTPLLFKAYAIFGWRIRIKFHRILPIIFTSYHIVLSCFHVSQMGLPRKTEQFN